MIQRDVINPYDEDEVALTDPRWVTPVALAAAAFIKLFLWVRKAMGQAYCIYIGNFELQYYPMSHLKLIPAFGKRLGPTIYLDWLWFRLIASY